MIDGGIYDGRHGSSREIASSRPAAKVATRYVVAVSLDEASRLAAEYGHDSEREAQAHLKEVQSPRNRNRSAHQYKVWKVEAKC